MVIYDRRGMSKSNKDKDYPGFAKKFAQMVQDYYAERLGMMYVVGATLVFRGLFKLVKPFLAKKTKQKIRILNSERELKEFFDVD